MWYFRIKNHQIDFLTRTIWKHQILWTTWKILLQKSINQIYKIKVLFVATEKISQSKAIKRNKKYNYPKAIINIKVQINWNIVPYHLIEASWERKINKINLEKLLMLINPKIKKSIKMKIWKFHHSKVYKNCKIYKKD